MKDSRGNKACCLTCRHAIVPIGIGVAEYRLCKLLQGIMDREGAPSVSWWFVCEKWEVCEGKCREGRS